MQYGDLTSLRRALKSQHDRELHELEERYKRQIEVEQQQQQERIEHLENEYAKKKEQERQRLRHSLLHAAELKLAQQEQQTLQKLTRRMYENLRSHFRTTQPLSTQQQYLKNVRQALKKVKTPTVIATTTTYAKKLSTTVKKDQSITGVKITTEYCIYDYTLESFFTEHEDKIHTLLLDGTK